MATQQEIAQSPEWQRINLFCKTHGLSRTQVYRLLKIGAIKSATLKTCPANMHGIRMIFVPSFYHHMEKLSAEQAAN